MVKAKAARRAKPARRAKAAKAQLAKAKAGSQAKLPRCWRLFGKPDHQLTRAEAKQVLALARYVEDQLQRWLHSLDGVNALHLLHGVGAIETRPHATSCVGCLVIYEDAGIGKIPQVPKAARRCLDGDVKDEDSV